MKKISLFIVGILILSSCHIDRKFNVKGVVADAKGKMLYLEASGLAGVTPLDSVKLSDDGEFSFKQPHPESPEFYRLRVDDKIINFAIDSTETIDIKSRYNNFSTGYTVTGSDNCSKIKELTLLQISLQKKVDGLIKDSQTGKLTNDVFEDSLASVINHFKDTVKINYIYSAPNTSAAYFALFQKINDYLIFDPLNSREDIKCFGAVATSLNNFYPHADRSKNLYNIVIKGMRNTRAPKQKTVEIPQDKISEAGVIDVVLKNNKGKICKLSELKGKVVILDFTIYQSAVSASHNFTLRDLYNKYAARGLQIYQVSLDADEHYWRTATDNLPWICVRDENGIYSNIAALYNVKQLPSYFVVNRNNELSVRGDGVKNLEENVKKLL